MLFLSMSMEHLFVILFFLIGNALSQEVQVQLSKDEAVLGDEVTFTCKVKDPSNIVILEKMVNFIDGSTGAKSSMEEQISSGVDVYPKYIDTNRFQLSTTQEGEWINYNLKISDLKREDTANYACRILDTNAYDHKLLEAQSSPINIVMKTPLTHTSDFEPKAALIVNEHTETEIECRVTGAVPLPSVQMKLGGKVLPKSENDNISTRKPDCFVSAYEGCLLHFTTDVSVKSKVNLDFTSDGQPVTCEAFSSGSNMEKSESQKIVQVHHIPKFECSQTQTAYLGEKEAVISCVVLANPSLQTVMFEFLYNQREESLQPGSRTDDNKIHVLETKISSTEVEIKLVVKEVKVEHFMEYNLKASNQMGQNSTLINFRNSGDSLVTNGNFKFVCFLSFVVYLFETL